MDTVEFSLPPVAGDDTLLFLLRFHGHVIVILFGAGNGSDGYQIFTYAPAGSERSSSSLKSMGPIP